MLRNFLLYIHNDINELILTPTNQFFSINFPHMYLISTIRYASLKKFIYKLKCIWMDKTATRLTNSLVFKKHWKCVYLNILKPLCHIISRISLMLQPCFSVGFLTAREVLAFTPTKQIRDNGSVSFTPFLISRTTTFVSNIFPPPDSRYFLIRLRVRFKSSIKGNSNDCTNARESLCIVHIALSVIHFMPSRVVYYFIIVPQVYEAIMTFSFIF